MDTIRIVSCRSDQSAFVFRDVAAYLTARGMPATMIEGIPHREREGLFNRGGADLVVLSGASLARRDDLEVNVELLVAPVPRAARYKQRAIRFVDLVVRRDSQFEALPDLRSASWAELDAEPDGGCPNFVRYLESIGVDAQQFGRRVATGTYGNALRMIAEGRLDALAIDSDALELAYRLHPELAPDLRTLQTFGPWPGPALLASGQLAPAVRHRLKGLLLDMHEDPMGRSVLADALIACLVPVSPSHYAAAKTRRARRRAPSSEFANELR